MNRWLCFFFLCLSTSALADETVRRIQEELRKRNLYFGDIDGQNSPVLSTALKRYQTRKGFPVTGMINAETSASLNVLDKNAAVRWPDVTVLKSDPAPNLPPSQQIALEKQAETNPASAATPLPAPPAESPAPAQNILPERITQLVEQYLADSETNDIAAQTQYFDYPVTYFDHGNVGAAFVQKDVTNYVKRWPERKYSLSEPVTFLAAENDGETRVEFQIEFRVRNQKYAVTGRTRNFWTLRSRGDDLKIVSIREERLRE